VAVVVLAVVVGLGASGSSSSLRERVAVTKPRLAPAFITITPPRAITPPAATATLSSLTVVHLSPANNADGVGFRAPLVVTYNRPPGVTAEVPTILPSTPGQWEQAGEQLRFLPSGYWRLGTTYRVRIELGSISAAANTRMVRFTTGLPSVLLLQQYLAMLGYLPLRFTPTGAIANRKAVLEREPTNPDLLPPVPFAGTFAWAYPGVPESLSAQWIRGQLNAVTTSAVMQFELAEGLVPDGIASEPVWAALLKAVAGRQMNTSPYNYVIVSESLPETLYVWQDGKFVYNTLVNTGVLGAATPEGTWPVDYKQNPNLMKGCDVNGYCYSVWVAFASYFLPSVGDAIHAYPRYGYGYPQSNGCVEVEPSQGPVVYSYDPVGTLVTVSSWIGPAQ
jgi:peptidoglycan hydrolase-like protein with peptidoglycan-binding domain